ncbi:hypothetical protein Y023_5095 [Burkholderia pseudomallei A79D]|nr:hypothetical protein Y023_5095 [Burkholderia pseudomallei A79D]KGX97311.1 hypothetical protein X997_4778 [Burkholderia pseudomallei A79C]
MGNDGGPAARCSCEHFPLRGRQAAGQHHRENEPEQRERQRCAERPVAPLRELHLDQVADHHRMAAAEQIRDHVRAERGHEHEADTRGDARHAVRNHHIAQRSPLRGAEIVCGFDDAPVEIIETRVHGQHHERKERVQQADQRGGRRIEQPQRAGEHAETVQRAVGETVVGDQDDPCVRAYDEARPERNRHENQQRVLAARRLRRDEERGGHAERDAAGRGRGRQRERAREDADMIALEYQIAVEIAIDDQIQIGIEREAAPVDAAVGERAHQRDRRDDGDRQQCADHEQGDDGAQQLPVARG